MDAEILPPFVMLSPPHHLMATRRGGGLFVGLSALVLLILVGSVLAAFFLYRYLSPSPSPRPLDQVVGHAFFVSSGQWSNVGSSSEQANDVSSQGDNDKLRIQLNSVPAPAAGKRYYAWLLS